MAKTTSINIGDHFEEFIASQVQRGRYGSASEVIRASLRLLEQEEQKIEALRQALIDGENSGTSVPLDKDKIRASAKEKGGLTR